MRCVFVNALLLAAAATAWAGAHTWDVNEVFSNASGTIQFVELREANNTPNETGLPGNNLTSNAETFLIPGPALTPPTSNKFFLIATPDFAALPGAPTPDRILPAANIPFFATGGDTVTYGPYDSLVFGPVPTNGIDSLRRNRLHRTEHAHELCRRDRSGRCVLRPAGAGAERARDRTGDRAAAAGRRRRRTALPFGGRLSQRGRRASSLP